MLRELGSRSQHLYAAIREPHELVVAQRYVRRRGGDSGASACVEDGGNATALDGESMALMLRDARSLAKNWHPNLARVRHVDLGGPDRPELTLATEWLDGATLSDLFAQARLHRPSLRGPPLPLPVLLRILLDVLTGLHALHHLPDGMNAVIGAIHGELCPANIVVATDGCARLVNALRPRPVHVSERSEALGYAAPEARDAAGTEDPRADLYAVGVMLWEGVAGEAFFKDTHPARRLARQRQGERSPVPIDPSSTFAPLAAVTMRALAVDPAQRFQNAVDMAAELRKAAGSSLASGSAVAACVGELAAEHIRRRRNRLDPAVSGTRMRASEPSIKDGDLPGPRDSAPDLAHYANLGQPAVRATRDENTRPKIAFLAAETPGDFEVPIHAGEAPSACSTQRRRRNLTIPIVVVLLGGATFAAILSGRTTREVEAPSMRMDDPPREPRAGSGTNVAADSPLASPTPPPALVAVSPPSTSEPSVPVGSASPTARALFAPLASPRAAKKPKKSLYDPDGH